VCRPTKEEVGEYLDLVDKASRLHEKMRDSCLHTPQFAEQLVPGAVVMVQAPLGDHRLSVVLGLESSIKVLSSPAISTVCFDAHYRRFWP
jgi:hypothetical protein